MLNEVCHTEISQIISVIHSGHSFQKLLVGANMFTVNTLKVLYLIDSGKTEEINRRKDDVEEAFAAQGAADEGSGGKHLIMRQLRCLLCKTVLQCLLPIISVVHPAVVIHSEMQDVLIDEQTEIATSLASVAKIY